MSFEHLTYEVVDGVARITINRPEMRNALNFAVVRELRIALQSAQGDDGVHAVVFHGAGEKAFVAGADINQLRRYTLHDGLRSEMRHLYDQIERFDKPTIAAVNGFALGGGCELALACDIRIASSTARFGLPETALGILPGAGGTQRMSRLVGLGRTIEMVLTGRLIPADEALRIGLVTAVVDPAALLDEAMDAARTITSKGPLAVRLAKLVIRTGADVDMHSGQVLEQLAQSLLYTTDDKAEGTSAFVEKRSAKFEGR